MNNEFYKMKNLYTIIGAMLLGGGLFLCVYILFFAPEPPVPGLTQEEIEMKDDELRQKDELIAIANEQEEAARKEAIRYQYLYNKKSNEMRNRIDNAPKHPLPKDLSNIPFHTKVRLLNDLSEQVK